MFNNAVNLSDVRTALAVLLHPMKLLRVLSLPWRRDAGVTEVWSRPHQATWLAIPAVRARINTLVSGNATESHYAYVARTHLAGRTGLMALSLGCGKGEHEVHWAQQGVFDRIDAYDLSPTNISEAKKRADEHGYGDIIACRAGDVLSVEMPVAAYDVVICEHSLHHFSPLTQAVGVIARSLKPGGLLVLDDFVGPSRFQWTDKQLSVATALLSMLPRSYRRLPDGRGMKERVVRPSRLRMFLTDPSEAVESSQIIPLLRDSFAVLDRREYGGTILHPLFEGIAQNFLHDDIETLEWLRAFCCVEDFLLSTGDISSDFALIVCRQRK